MATARCAHCESAMRTDETGLSRAHEGSEFEVTRFVCPDCGSKGFRASETFESTRYKGSSVSYQWGALEDDELYGSPPWLANGYGVFVDGGEPVKEFDDENDAEAYADRMGDACSAEFRVEAI